jgi:hypothetical protein
VTVSAARDQFWHLLETPAEKAEKLKTMRALYALVDPNGYDARKLAAKPKNRRNT